MSDSAYEKALAFAAQKHDGQFRIGGLPYITHPVEVSKYVRDWGYGEDYQIAALFHDLLEDTDTTDEEIVTYSNDSVLTAVKLLTKVKPYNMNDYINNIKNNDIARIVKAADRLHNLRCAVTTSEEFKRKYILETVDYYLGFHSEIKTAVKNLAKTLEKPMTELSFIYEPIDTWKL